MQHAVALTQAAGYGLYPGDGGTTKRDTTRGQVEFAKRDDAIVAEGGVEGEGDGDEGDGDDDDE